MTVDEIKDLLKAVKYPGMSRDIVSFGMVKEVVQRGPSIEVTLDVPTQDDRVIAQIQQDAEHCLRTEHPEFSWEVKALKRSLSAGAAQGFGVPQRVVLPGVKQVIAVASGKGGVGKSTVATNLALALRASGASVGLMDADAYGPSLPVMYGLSGHPHMTESQQLIPLEFRGIKVMSLGFLTSTDSPVIWRGPIVTKLIRQFLGGVEWGTLDYLIIDLPPGTGDIQLTLVQSAPIDGALIVTTPQEVALTIAHKGLKMFQEVNVPVIGIVENMSGFVCPHCGAETPVFKRGGGARVAQASGVPLLVAIPLDPAVAGSGDAGVPVVERAPHAQAAQAYRKLAEAVKEQMQRLDQERAAWTAVPTNIEVTAEGRLKIEWSDGQVSLLAFRPLRAACPCAACVNEHTGERVLTLDQVPVNIRPLEVHPVGRYALSIRWSDGHSTGIYAFRYLRTLDEAVSAAPAR